MADTIISDGQGHYKILKGNQWVDYSGPPPGGTGANGGKLSAQAQNFLNTLSQQAADASETRRIYDRADSAIQTLKPGPWRGRMLDMAIPTEGGGVLDTIGAAVIGAPMRALGAITPKEVSAYQTLKGLQSEQVLGKQLLQKGPQTESDAARLQLTEISPNKDAATNEQVIQSGKAKADRARAKAIFYTHFANKWGLNGTSPHGYTADQLWASDGDRITESLFGGKEKTTPTVTIHVLSRRKVK